MTATSAANAPGAPYSDPGTNQIYHLLFCDDPAGFAPRHGTAPAPWQQVLYAKPFSASAVQALAEDATQEGRVRMLAFNALRAEGHIVASRELLGIVIEVPLDGGLDVLAAFAGDGVRYINQTGHVVVVEGSVAPLAPIVERLFAASRNVVARIGPWDKSRLPPPHTPNIRLSFLVANGLYFGEGPMAVMEREPLAAPVITAATELLQAVVKLDRR